MTDNNNNQDCIKNRLKEDPSIGRCIECHVIYFKATGEGARCGDCLPKEGKTKITRSKNGKVVSVDYL